MNQDQLHELLYQALETDLGGVQVYETQLRSERRVPTLTPIRPVFNGQQMRPRQRCVEVLIITACPVAGPVLLTSRR